MIGPGNTYHYIGPLNAWRLLAARPNPAWRATIRSDFRAIFSCMRQHGHF